MNRTYYIYIVFGPSGIKNEGHNDVTRLSCVTSNYVASVANKLFSVASLTLSKEFKHPRDSYCWKIFHGIITTTTGRCYIVVLVLLFVNIL